MNLKMRALALKGGAARKASARPGEYAEIGALGGRASKGKPRTKRAVVPSRPTSPSAALRPTGYSFAAVREIVAELEA